MMNPHNKQGTPVFFTKQDLENLYTNENFQTLMTWVEKSLRMTKCIMSPEFFHPSFTKKQKDLIISMIYSCYDVVEDIQPLGKNGVVITSSNFLTMTELP